MGKGRKGGERKVRKGEMRKGEEGQGREEREWKVEARRGGEG